jgi:peptidoglycan hydrolase CwlO-like protein
MTKQLLAVVVVAVVLSTVIGFTIGSSTSPENANAATEQTEVVKQLKRLNVQMAGLNGQMAALNMKTSALNSKTGDTQTAEGSVRGLLTIICDYTAPINCKPR